MNNLPRTYSVVRVTGISTDITPAEAASIFTPVGVFQANGHQNGLVKGVLCFPNAPTAGLFHQRLSDNIYYLRGSRLLVGPVHNRMVNSDTLANEIDRIVPRFGFDHAFNRVKDRIDGLSGFGLSIKNISPITTKQQLVDLFQTKGTVRYPRFMMKNKSKKSENGIKFAFVNYRTDAEALYAFRELNEYELHGFELAVSPAFQGKKTEAAAARPLRVTPASVARSDRVEVRGHQVTEQQVNVQPVTRHQGTEQAVTRSQVTRLVGERWAEELDMGEWEKDREDVVPESEEGGDLMYFSESDEAGDLMYFSD